MTSAKLSLFSGDVRVLSAEGSKQSGLYEYRYFGILDPLPTQLRLNDLSSGYRSWVAVGARSGSATVLVGEDEFTVEPGLPLLVLSPETYEGAPEVLITALESGSDLEIYVFTSEYPMNPPEPAFLVLNAGTGVTEDEFGGGVNSWRDTRANSLAPLEFPWSDNAETRPTLIDSDPDFGGKPSVSFAESGEGRFLYEDTESAALFDFMNGGEDFTVMAIMSAPDDALDDFSDLNSHHGIWGTPDAGAEEGGHALIESGYRHMTAMGISSSDYILSEDEFVEKPFVIMWQFSDGGATQTLRVYWQGRWHDEESLPNGSGSASVLGVGAAVQQGQMRYMRGKIADFRVYKRHLTSAEKLDYFAMAVNEYGIDDTAGQGFPWVGDCVNMHRANRGVNWKNEEETVLDFWNDTRWAGAGAGQARYFTITNPDLGFDYEDYISPKLQADEYLGGQPSFLFTPYDSGYADSGGSGLANEFNGGTGDHLTGFDGGMTVTFVFYVTDDPVDSPLMSMGVYGTGTDGTDIAWYNSENGFVTYLSAENNSGNATAYRHGESPVSLYVPMAIVYRLDGTNSVKIDELNLATGVHRAKIGEYDTSGPGSSDGTVRPVYMGTWSSDAGEKFPGSIPEMTTAARMVSNEEVLQFFDYARQRYGYGDVPRQERVITYD